MKTRVLMIALMAFTLTATVMAAPSKAKKSNKEVVVFSVPMDCDGCRTKILEYMSFEKGVKAIDASLAQQTVTITFNPKQTDKARLIQAFTKIDKKAVEKTVCEKPCDSQHKPACTDHHHDHNHDGHHHHGHNHSHQH